MNFPLNQQKLQWPLSDEQNHGIINKNNHDIKPSYGNYLFFTQFNCTKTSAKHSFLLECFTILIIHFGQ